MSDVSVDDFLAGYSPEVRALALRACEILHELLPAATVSVKPGWKAISFATGPKMGDWVCGVMPHRDRINLQLFGMDLADPAGLLEGTGKTGRHVKVTSLDTLDDPALRALLHAAVEAHGTPAGERAASVTVKAGEHRASASKTFPVPVDALFAAWADDATRLRWLGRHPVTIRGITPGKSLRARWDEMPLDVRFESKGESKSSVAIDHRGIASAEEATRIKEAWSAALDRLKQLLAE
ncbi:MAG TPA: DUF1801 domain-containing protein [Longimicrobium sp.]|nr:DUF1801 domain-containing protein [Longimicrobium sp.]